MRKYLGQGKKNKAQGNNAEGGRDVTNIRNGKFADQKTEKCFAGKIFFKKKKRKGNRGVTTQK